MDGALAAANAALESARDIGAISSALEAKAWALLLAGSRKDAAETLAQAASIGAPIGALRAVLEFRLAAVDGIVAARKRADALKLQSIGDRAALAMAVMLGDKDLRDIKIDSQETASELATYLVGYRLAPQPVTGSRAGQSAVAAAAPITATTASGPVVVVSEPESVGADEATLAVARLSCKDALVKRGRFRVVDAESRKAAMDELELSLSGATAGDKDKAVGQLFSADFVVSGSVVKTDSGWLVAFTLASAGDGHIVASDFSVAQDHAAIMTEAGRFAESLDGLASSSRE
jgi:TolB-like protein